MTCHLVNLNWRGVLHLNYFPLDTATMQINTAVTGQQISRDGLMDGVMDGQGIF